MDRNTLEIMPAPKPAGRMDKIRRSLSFRRKKKPSEKLKSKETPTITTNLAPSSSCNTPTSAPNTANSTAKANETSVGASKPSLWIEDEKRVRAGNCSFQVKVYQI